MKEQSIVEFVHNGPSLQVGEMLVRQLADGTFWLENKAGEGTQVSSRDLENLLWRFHGEQFW